MQYIGPKEIASMEDSVFKTIEGVEIPCHKVTFSDNSIELIPVKTFNAVALEMPSDLSDLRNRKTYPIVKEMLELMLSYNVKLSEIDYIFQLVTTSINENMEKMLTTVLKHERQERSLFDMETVFKGSEVPVADVAEPDLTS
jgi:hypothetical protein